MSSSHVHLQIEQALAEKKSWLADEFNQQFLCQKSLETLDEFVAGRESHIGKVLGSFTSLSHWFGVKGVIDILEGRSSNYLCDSFWFDMFHHTVMNSSFQTTKKEGAFRAIIKRKVWPPRPTISFNDQGLLLAKSFALGLVPLGEAIGHQSLAGLKDGIFYGRSQNQLTPFLLTAFAKWKQIPLPPEDLPEAIPDAYVPLLDKLTSPPEKIQTALMTACNFHLSRSRMPDDWNTYEFSHGPYPVYPVEILFLFRIRQLLGLENPEVDHPLLNSPVGKLPEIKCAISPQFEPLRDKIRSEYSAWPAATDS